jgi:mRNA-degrading endonuclease RelE of RelBE toxin-antitoxin system
MARAVVSVGGCEIKLIILYCVNPIGVDLNTPMGYNWSMNGMILQTVVETPEFIKQAKECMNEGVVKQFIDFIAKNPLAGDVIPGTGGARKVRWQSDEHCGKRGGARIIYYYHDDEMPIYLFTAYKKNQRETITAEEKKILYKIIKSIVKAHKEAKDE